MTQQYRRDAAAPAEKYNESTGNESTRDDSAGLVLGQLTGNRGPAPGVVACRRALPDRRRRSIGGFLYGNFRPRRRNVRRSDDHHRILFDWHEPRLLYVALAVLLLSCVDALFTLNLLLLGAEEANVLMNSLLAESVDSFLAVKISMTAIAIVLLVAASRRKFLGLIRVSRLLQLICLGYVVLIGYEIWLFSFVFNFGLADSLLPMLAVGD